MNTTSAQTRPEVYPPLQNSSNPRTDIPIGIPVLPSEKMIKSDTIDLSNAEQHRFGKPIQMVTVQITYQIQNDAFIQDGFKNIEFNQKCFGRLLQNINHDFGQDKELILLFKKYYYLEKSSTTEDSDHNRHGSIHNYINWSEPTLCYFKTVKQLFGIYCYNYFNVDYTLLQLYKIKYPNFMPTKQDLNDYKDILSTKILDLPYLRNDTKYLILGGNLQKTMTIQIPEHLLPKLSDDPIIYYRSYFQHLTMELCR